MNAFVVIENLTPTPSGVQAFFFGPDAEANALAWRDANKPGFGVVPATVPSATIFNGVTITL